MNERISAAGILLSRLEWARDRNDAQLQREYVTELKRLGITVTFDDPPRRTHREAK